MLRPLKHVVSILFRPVLDALWFGRRLPWKYRWRLLAFQPVNVLANLLVSLPYVFRRPFTVDYIPIAPGRELRVLVYKHPDPSDRVPNDGPPREGRLRPLHINCHGGGFVGGYPEIGAPFCELVARETGAVVVSLSYRLAPVHPFPAAPDDVDAAVRWLRANAAARYGADPALTTTSGSSAGGALILAAAQVPASPPSHAFRAMVGFSPVVDMSTKPADKPRPKELEKDPLHFMQELYDSYAVGNDPTRDDPRLSPALAPPGSLPPRILFIVARIDILVQEELEFIERFNNDAEARGDPSRKAEYFWVEDGFHGYLEVPDYVIPKEKKMVAFNKALDLIREVHGENGWTWRP